ncbi:hypothetical protein [Rosistilla oblonga]|uniref:hypothetical protein n=1 Tax=Rosistilla oblonga TaxID=2527990 RepID=UPI003A97EE3E
MSQRRRKKIPTVAQHQRIGHSLKAVNDLLLNTAGLIDVCESQGGEDSRWLRKTIRELLDIRSKREAQLCEEHPDLPELDLLNAYFGSTRDRDAIRKIAEGDGQAELHSNAMYISATNKESRRDR